MNYLEQLASALAYGALGLILLVVGYFVIDLLTPGHLGKAISRTQSRSAAVVLGAMLLALGAVVASSIAAARGDNTWKGLGETLGYSLVGIVLLAVSFTVVDALTPGKLGDVLESERVEPVAWVLAAFMVGVGAILAAAIS